MMFKKKLNADVFVSIPMDNLIYPMLVEGIKEKYNDVSVMCENPNYENNIKGIDKLTYIYTELQSLLYFLYCNGRQSGTVCRGYHLFHDCGGAEAGGRRGPGQGTWRD